MLVCKNDRPPSLGARASFVAAGRRLMRDVRPGLRNCGRRGRKLSRDHFAVEEVAPLPFYPWYFDKRKTCRHWFLSKQVMVSPAILALDKQLVDSRPVFLVVQAGSHSARATRYNRPQGQFFARALCLLMDCSFLFCPSRTSGAALSFGGAQDESAAPELLTGLVVKSGVLAIKPVALLPIQCHNFGYRKARSNMASSRPPIRCELQSYFRVVIVFRGARVMRRTLGGGLCPRWARDKTWSCIRLGLLLGVDAIKADLHARVSICAHNTVQHQDPCGRCSTWKR